MIAKTKTYLTEALKCDVIVLATALSPAFRLSIFRAWFPTKANVVNSLAYEFDKTRNQAKAIHHHQTVAEVDFFPDASASTHLDELSIYLLGKYKLAASQAGQLLKWWKEGFKADSEFESAQAIVSQLMEDIQESKPKKAVIGDNSSRPLAIE
ncbi:hypothetical protein PCANC_22678 [Puccinia coronata f. sp. avenae]|uniref:HAT C-terminal dimerisation domain-containing protein n=1 Tax=Puccinia coronata f. sp. avenae TaxID=200324 RepID=A0A2N5SB51_9BASI|nr:hypothetical protein PCANC_22678 [Puccinia coronata f. sp. avenae]